MLVTRNIFPALVFSSIFIVTGCGGGSSSGDESNNSSSPGISSGSHTISGSLINLPANSSLVIKNNNTDELALNSDGVFMFGAEISGGESYQVTIVTQPSAETFCNVRNGYGSASANVSNVAIYCMTGAFNVVDTNQNKCYSSISGAETSCSNSGYDADYSGNQPNYTVSDDGNIVYDNVTGLIWTQSPNTNSDSVINSSDKMTQPNAVSYCDSLTAGGYSWRLPDIKELYSLMDFSGGDPSGYMGNDTSALTPFISSVFTAGFGEVGAGERIIDGQYATETLYVSPLGTIDGAATMFGVNFVDGRIKGYPYSTPANNPKTFYVLCVTGN